MTQVVKGDAYILPIKIMQGTSPLTPSDVTDVRIQVGDILKTYSKNEITFDTTTNEWNYPLTQKQTYEFSDNFTKVQVGVKIGTDIKYSFTQSININENIIQKEW